MDVKVKTTRRLKGASIIAKELGVSVSIVCRVVNGKARSKRISDFIFEKYGIKSKGVKDYGSFCQ